MKNVYRLHILIVLFVIVGCNTDKKIEKKSINPKVEKVHSSNPDCVEFVALWSAGDIAEKIGKDKKWVFLNYTIDLWDIPPSEGSGNIVGKLRASSYARIIKKKGELYMVYW